MYHTINFSFPINLNETQSKFSGGTGVVTLGLREREVINCFTIFLRWSIRISFLNYTSLGINIFNIHLALESISI